MRKTLRPLSRRMPALGRGLRLGANGRQRCQSSAASSTNRRLANASGSRRWAPHHRAASRRPRSGRTCTKAQARDRETASAQWGASVGMPVPSMTIASSVDPRFPRCRRARRRMVRNRSDGNCRPFARRWFSRRFQSPATPNRAYTPCRARRYRATPDRCVLR